MFFDSMYLVTSSAQVVLEFNRTVQTICSFFFLFFLLSSKPVHKYTQLFHLYVVGLSFIGYLFLLSTVTYIDIYCCKCWLLWQTKYYDRNIYFLPRSISFVEHSNVNRTTKELRAIAIRTWTWTWTRIHFIYYNSSHKCKSFFFSVRCSGSIIILVILLWLRLRLRFRLRFCVCESGTEKRIQKCNTIYRRKSLIKKILKSLGTILMSNSIRSFVPSFVAPTKCVEKVFICDFIRFWYDELNQSTEQNEFLILFVIVTLSMLFEIEIVPKSEFCRYSSKWWTIKLCRLYWTRKM